ncbi:hypothetical protein ACFLZO_00940 [Patescibacteria group bacterium]
MEEYSQTHDEHELHDQISEEYLSWEIDEFPYYERGTVWYLSMIGGGIVLLIYAVISANFLFALIILMFALILYLSSATKPRRVLFTIGDTGIRIGDTFHAYGDIQHFWFIYEPPQVKDLHLDFRSTFRPRMTVELSDQNPNEVRELLQNFILEDITKEEESLSDVLGRILKI